MILVLAGRHFMSRNRSPETRCRCTKLMESMYMDGRIHSLDKEYRRYRAQTSGKSKVVYIKTMPGEQLIVDMKSYMIRSGSSYISGRTHDAGGLSPDHN